ncbi:MAG: sensor histidine kinase, partial [Caldilineaceae bacterium]
PLRVRLQAGINRLIYGERDNPVTVLARLGQQLEGTLEPEMALAALTETIARSLKLPYVALELQGTDGALAAWGTPVGAPDRFPLHYRGERLGTLLVSPRSEYERLSQADRRLLETVVLQAGPAVQAQQLTRQLGQSRHALVLAREEERRRLRRDLHDGLGPMLASQALTLEAVARRLENDPKGATTLLHAVKKQTQEAVRDIRRIVYDLRPPALDDLGLLEALRLLAQQALQVDGAGPQVLLDVPNPLSQLPAAVEVATYRIAQEALTNAVRHARATQIVLRFHVDSGALHLMCCDDGVGLAAQARPGVGMRSMRERVAELGGTLAFEPAPGTGLCVHAVLPME